MVPWLGHNVCFQKLKQVPRRKKKKLTASFHNFSADGIIGSEAFVPIYSLLDTDYLLLIVIAEATDGYIFIGWFES